MSTCALASLRQSPRRANTCLHVHGVLALEEHALSGGARDNLRAVVEGILQVGAHSALLGTPWAAECAKAAIPAASRVAGLEVVVPAKRACAAYKRRVIGVEHAFVFADVDALLHFVEKPRSQFRACERLDVCSRRPIVSAGGWKAGSKSSS